MHALRDRTLFFLHIPKTAGISLRELLSTRFSPTETLTFERSDSRDLHSEKLASVDRYRFVHGHMPYALVDRFERHPFVATILRDPLERAVSAFHHMQRQVPAMAQAFKAGDVSAARARDYAAAGRMSIGELIRREPLAASRHLGNLQAWLLATPNVSERFEYRDEYRVSVFDSDLERAKEHLAACDFVGLTERMNESVYLLADSLQGDPFCEVGMANRGPARPAVASLDPATIEALVDLTAQDRELYAFACRLFEERRRAMSLGRARCD
ncbi:MAG TPA: sulfotransferase family 2 domain-containing protein [Thermoanaerobaculia bacterium]|nr:sulfotransferase family 2 domain-containing protein [Thermoanaerobaculia bacterium]